MRFPVNGRYDGSEIMDTFEIHDDEIDVEEIMKKIKDNIRMRKEAGVYPQDGIEMDPAGNSPECSTNVQRDLEYINANWDIQNNSYFISSHRPVVGKPLVKGRELVHGEVRRYVDPIIWKQTEFNGSTARYLNNVNEKINSFENVIDGKIEQLRPEIDGKIEQLRPEIDDKIEQLRPEIDGKIEQLRPEIDGKIEQLRPEIDDKIEQLRPEINDMIESQVSSVISSMNSDIENKAWLANILEGKIKGEFENLNAESPDIKDADVNYFVFEDRFRGSREDIKQRQAAFLHYFEQCSNVLDIGCGRGEFLELLRDNGITAHGVDINEDMAGYCHSKGLDVKIQDAIEYLETLEDKSLDGIFIDQVVEHLEPDYLIKLLGLCQQKLRYGCHLVAETVNPLSLSSFANFYADLTHKKPVHPETLKFLFESAGFRDIDSQFFSPVSDEARLKKMPVDEDMNLKDKKCFDVYNHNVDMLNNILYGPQDYSVIGRK
ncbi:MAG: hypothetical protein A9957_04095 [Methanohalophilus sp. DAL1]|nr:MAG: hypothetical protein A9957_04095 [Methanohalophilus sp. DAL1]